ncbi:MAG: recombinase family protein [Planctomycetota bacterium]
MPRPKNVFVGYARTTGDEESARDSWERQRHALERYAESRGLDMIRVYWDRGIEGQAASYRSGIFTLLDEVPLLGITDVLVTRVDRLIREGEIGRQILKELEGHRVSIHSLTEDESKVRQDTKRITASTVAALKSANTKILALKRGKAPAGRAPYGYRREAVAGDSTTKLVVVKDEASVVQWIFREYLRKRSMAKVAKGLADKGIPAPGGKEWSRASVAWILGNEIYIGNVKFGTQKNKGEHEAIIAAVIFHKVQRLRQTNRRMRKRKKGEPDTGVLVGDAAASSSGDSAEGTPGYDPFAEFDRQIETSMGDDKNSGRPIEAASADASDDTVTMDDSTDDASASDSGDGGSDDDDRSDADDFVFEPLTATEPARESGNNKRRS